MYFQFSHVLSVCDLICLQCILVFSFINYEPAKYGKYSYPLWADGVGWLLTMSSVIPIFVVAIYMFAKADGDTIMEASTHPALCNIILQMFCFLYEFIVHNKPNRRFPRSMRSQGEHPGCGSHVKRVDHGDAFNAWRYVKKRWRFIISCSNLICHGASGPIQHGQNWRNISQFTMWLSQSSVNVYQTYQSLYQFQHFAAKRDSAMDKWCLPQ